MKTFGKAVLSLVLLALAYVCFYYLQPPEFSRSTAQKTTTETARNSSNAVVKITTTTEKQDSSTEASRGKARYWEIIGYGCLVLSVWIWRLQLGIKGLPGVVGTDVTPQPPNTPPSSEDDSAHPLTSQIQQFISKLPESDKILVEAILAMFTHVHAVTVTKVSSELKVSKQDALKLLLRLRVAGILRIDGFPKATIFTLASSIENLTLDKVREEIAASDDILSERRFVRVGHLYDIDSILTCESRTFIVEAKYLRNGSIVARLDDWTLQLLTVAKEFAGKPVGCILAVTCGTNVDVAVAKRDAMAVTFDSDRVQVKVMVFGEDEIQKVRKA